MVEHAIDKNGRIALFIQNENNEAYRRIKDRIEKSQEKHRPSEWIMKSFLDCKL